MPDNVQFDTDVQNSAVRRPGPAASFGQTTSEASGMAGWLMRHHLAKSPESAQIVMIAVIVVDIIAVFIIVKYFI